MTGIFYALLAATFWAASVIVIRGAMTVWPVGHAGVYSRIIAVVLLSAAIGATGRGWRRLLPGPTWRLLLLMGVVAAALNLLCFAGLKYTSATSAALLIRLDLVFVVLIGALLRLEHLTPRGLLTLPVMLLGLALVMEAHHVTWTDHIAGDLMIVLAALGLAINAFIIRQILHHMDEQAVTFYNMLLTGIAFAILAAFEEPIRLASFPPQAWAWLITLGITSATATAVYYAALRRMKIWRLRAYLLISPLLVAIVEWIIWGIQSTPTQWFGAALLLAGVAALVLDELQMPPAQGATSRAADNAPHSEPGGPPPGCPQPDCPASKA